MKLPFPQSLAAQFALVVSCLVALVGVVGATTIWSLAGSAQAIRVLAEAQAARLAHEDQLTELLNRRGFYKALVEPMANE